MEHILLLTQTRGKGTPPAPPQFQRPCFCGLDKSDNSSSRSTELTTVLGLNEEGKNGIVSQCVFWNKVKVRKRSLSCSWHETTKPRNLFTPIFSKFFLAWAVEKGTHFLLVHNRFFLSFGRMKILISFLSRQTEKN